MQWNAMGCLGQLGWLGHLGHLGWLGRLGRPDAWDAAGTASGPGRHRDAWGDALGRLGTVATPGDGLGTAGDSDYSWEG